MTDPTPPLLPAAPLVGDDGSIPAPSVTDDDLFRVLGTFLTQALRIQVIRGQNNRVPMPKEGDFVVMTPLRRRQLSGPVHDYFPSEESALGEIQISRSTEYTVQLDIYGPQSGGKCQVFTTLFRDACAYDFMGATPFNPLYCDDGNQMPLIDGEKQYEQRWCVIAALQMNPAISTSVQFARSVSPVLIEVA